MYNAGIKLTSGRQSKDLKSASINSPDDALMTQNKITEEEYQSRQIKSITQQLLFAHQSQLDLTDQNYEFINTGH
jgi:hypothetical protein